MKKTNMRTFLELLAAGGVVALAAAQGRKRGIVDEVDLKLENSRKGFIAGKSPEYIVSEFAQAQELIHSPGFTGSPNTEKKEIVAQKFIDLGTEYSR